MYKSNVIFGVRVCEDFCCVLWEDFKLTPAIWEDGVYKEISCPFCFENEYRRIEKIIKNKFKNALLTDVNLFEDIKHKYPASLLTLDILSNEQIVEVLKYN